MNCREFESVVVEIARAGTLDAACERESMAHAKSCTRCALRLKNERRLTGAVTALMAEDAACGASPVTESMLMAAFRKQPASLKRNQRAKVTRIAAGAIAATLIVAGILAVRRPEVPKVAHVEGPAPPTIAPMIAPAPVVAPVFRELRKPPGRMQRTFLRR